MLMQDVAPNLTQALRDIQPAYRTGVMRALATMPRVQGQWVDEDGGGCFWAIATMRATGISRGHFMKSPAQTAAKTFGVSRARVEAVYQEWDGLAPEQLERWIAGVRAEVQASVEAAHQQQAKSFVRRSMAAARELVHY